MKLMKHLAACAAVLLLFATVSASAQQNTSQRVQAVHSYKNDLSQPLSLQPIPYTGDRDEDEHEGPANPQVPRHHVDSPDPVVQNTLAPEPQIPTPTLDFDGIGAGPGGGCNCAPPDTNGEVGDTQFVQSVNGGLQVFDKTSGASLLGPVAIESLWSGFGGVCQNNGDGDPVVLYDQLAHRWLISQFAGSGIPTDECVAISTSDDATSTYNRYGFHLGSNFFDYPHLGVWPDGYYMSMNVFNSAGTAYLGPQPFVFDRAKMLAGLPATFITTGNLGSTHAPLLPADLDGSLPPPVGAVNPFLETPDSVYKVYGFHADFTTPANSTFTLIGAPGTAPYTQLCPTTRNCVVQSGTTQKLDGIGDRLMFRLAYRNFGDHDAMVGNFTVSSGGVAGLRWFELRNPTASPTVFQQSTFQPDTTSRWLGSVALDGNGNMAIGYSASSSTIKPQIRYTGRLVNDPVGTLPLGEGHIFDGAGAQTGSLNRWGDYSALSIDPVDDCTFWYTNEYIPSDGSFNWKTRIGNFRLPGCTPQAFYDGALTAASPTFDNPNGSGIGTGVQYYCAQQFSVGASGAYVIETASPNTTGTPSDALDTFLRLYANTFDPAAPGGALTYSDDFSGALTVLPGPYTGTVSATSTGFQGAQPGSRMSTANLTAGTDYFLVQTSFRSTDYVSQLNEGQASGPFYTGIGGPGNVTLVGTCGAVAGATYTVTPSVGTPSGTITPDTAQTVNFNATPSFTLTPDAGYHIDTVTGTCGGTLAGNVFTTSAVNTDCTVIANFAIDTFTVTSSSSGNGTIAPSGAQTVSFNATPSFTLTPDAGYHIDTVTGTCGGTLASNVFTTSAVTADCTVIANFAIDTFTVTSSSSGNGTIAPSGAQTVNFGATPSFTLTPAGGFHIDNVGGTCGGTLAGNVFTTNAVSANCTVIANFAIDTFTVTSSSSGNGTIAPSGAQTVNFGATPSFTLTPDAGYHIDTVTGTCGGTLASSVFTTSAVTANCTVIANFAIDTFTVTSSSSGNGTIAPSGAQTVNFNATPSFTLTPDAGYHIDTVTGTCGGNLASNVFTTAPVSADCTVIANFAIDTFTVTSSSSGNGTIAPSGAQTVNFNATPSFTLTPDAGYHIDTVTGTCDGTLASNVFTTSAVTADCTVIANFAADPLPPLATVTPSAFTFSVAADSTDSDTLNIADATGHDPLTFSIDARDTTQPILRPHASALSKRSPLNGAGLHYRGSSARGHSNAAPPWAPIGPDGSVTFQADDGTYETAVSLNDGTTQFPAIFINRYQATGALTIDSISVDWPDVATGGGDVTGLSINLVAYYDADGDGDVTNAVRLGTDTFITIGSLNAFETYPTSFSVPGAGDVYIGFEDAFASGGTSPILYAGALDENGDISVGYISGKSTNEDPDLDNLANNDLTDTINNLTGGSLPGVWMVRATATLDGGGSPCTGPVLSWLTAIPASGTVNGGDNQDVTVTVDPAAGSLTPGNYTAELCLTTNDPTQTLISVPVSLEVTPGAATACNGGADEIFCNGFDPSGTPFVQPLQDPSFEATTAAGGSNPFWDSLDGNAGAAGGTVFYTGSGFGIPVHTGDFVAWFGGWGGGAETQDFSQTVTFPASGPLYLNYWRDVDVAPDVPSNMVVTIDGSPVQTTDLSTQLDADYVLQSIDISAYADGGSHEVKFTYDYDDSGTTDGNSFIDDVTIDQTSTPVNPR